MLWESKGNNYLLSFFVVISAGLLENPLPLQQQLRVGEMGSKDDVAEREGEATVVVLVVVVAAALIPGV